MPANSTVKLPSGTTPQMKRLKDIGNRQPANPSYQISATTGKCSSYSRKLLWARKTDFDIPALRGSNCCNGHREGLASQARNAEVAGRLNVEWTRIEVG